MIELMANINDYLLGKLPEIAARMPEEGLIPLNNHVPEEIFIPANINEDFFAGDTETELMCRHDVSPLITKRFLTGAYEAQFNFSYYMQSANVLICRRTLEAIQECLAIDNFTDLFGLKSGRMIVITRPTPVSRDGSGISIYTSSYRLEFQEETV